MPYPDNHKSKTREKILQSAAKLFSWQGFEQVSINAVMADVGLTRGAFYSHFSDKSTLYVEAIAYAARHSQLAKYTSDFAGDDGLKGLITAYLSRQHVDEETFPCPLAFLVTDVSQREPQVRNTYSRIYQHMVKRIGKLLPDTTQETRLAATAMMIGGVAIARTLDTPENKDELLVACRKSVLELLAIGETV